MYLLINHSRRDGPRMHQRAVNCSPLNSPPWGHFLKMQIQSLFARMQWKLICIYCYHAWNFWWDITFEKQHSMYRGRIREPRAASVFSGFAMEMKSWKCKLSRQLLERNKNMPVYIYIKHVMASNIFQSISSAHHTRVATANREHVQWIVAWEKSWKCKLNYRPSERNKNMFI